MSDQNNYFKFEMNFFSIIYEIHRRKTIYLQIPDTLICGYGFASPTLFTTEISTGELIIKKKLSPEAVSECFAYFEEAEYDRFFPIAVVKISTGLEQDHCRVLFTASECQQKWDDYFRKGRVIQKFIRNVNSLSLIKSSWSSFTSRFTATELLRHKNIKSAGEVYKKSIGNIKRKAALKEVHRKHNRELFQILDDPVPCASSPYTHSTLEKKVLYLVNSFEAYFLRNSNLKILSFDSDWIEDSSGQLHLITVKSYRIGEIDAFKPTLSLFHVPKININKLVPSKSRPEISMKNKFSVQNRSSSLCKFQIPRPYTT